MKSRKKLLKGYIATIVAMGMMTMAATSALAATITPTATQVNGTVSVSATTDIVGDATLKVVNDEATPVIKYIDQKTVSGGAIPTVTFKLPRGSYTVYMGGTGVTALGSVPLNVTADISAQPTYVPVAVPSVAPGTTKADAILTLPTTVQVALSDGTTAAVDVTWDCATYNANPTEQTTYAFVGTLVTTPYILNPSAYTLPADVIVGAPASQPTPSPTNIAPEVTAIDDQKAYVGGESVTIDLSTYFTDADNDTLTFTPSDGDDSMVTASVEGNILTLTPVTGGTTTYTVTADDQKGGTISTTIKAKVVRLLDVDMSNAVTGDDFDWFVNYMAGYVTAQDLIDMGMDSDSLDIDRSGSITGDDFDWAVNYMAGFVTDLYNFQ